MHLPGALMESALALLGRTLHRAVLAACLASTAGCGRLVAQPGHDFKLDILTPMPLRSVSRWAFLKCGSVYQAAKNSTRAATSEVQLEPTRADDGSYSRSCPSLGSQTLRLLPNQ